MGYDKTTWVNNSAPAINETNLNKIETGIDEAHDAIDNVTTGHDHDGVDSKKVTAGDVINVPSGNIGSTNVQTAINELDDEKVNKSTYNANSILAADTDNTPLVVTVAEQTLVGRITAGTINDLSVAQIQTLINVEDGADVTDAINVDAAGAVMESDFTINTILAGTTVGVPTAIPISASRLIGRTSTGDIEDLTAAEVLTIIGVEANADVTDAVNVASTIHGVTTKTPPVDDDEVGLIDSAAANVLKKLTWSNLKATLKTYFDSLYAGIGVNSDITSLTGLTTALDETYGGTGLDTYTQGDVLYASGSNTLAKLAKGTADQVLTMNAGATAPEWTGTVTTVVDDTSPQLGGDLDLNEHEILVDTTPGSDHTGSGMKGNFTNGNGVSVAFGDVCFMALDGALEFADADATTTMPGLYMALETITTETSGEWMIMGVVRDDTWNWTVGPGTSGLIYVSTTATTGNTLTQTAPSGSGDQVQIVGTAISADVMMFNPSLELTAIA